MAHLLWTRGIVALMSFLEIIGYPIGHFRVIMSAPFVVARCPQCIHLQSLYALMWTSQWTITQQPICSHVYSKEDSRYHLGQGR